jgi:hypothetical protein
MKLHALQLLTLTWNVTVSNILYNDNRVANSSTIPLNNLLVSGTSHCKGGRTRTDKIGVGAGADIGGTGISCNFRPGSIGTTTDMLVRCRRPPR